MMNIKQYNSSKLINFTIESLSDNLNNLEPNQHDLNCGCGGAILWPPIPDPGVCGDNSLCPTSVGITPDRYSY